MKLPISFAWFSVVVITTSSHVLPSNFLKQFLQVHTCSSMISWNIFFSAPLWPFSLIQLSFWNFLILSCIPGFRVHVYSHLVSCKNSFVNAGFFISFLNIFGFSYFIVLLILRLSWDILLKVTLPAKKWAYEIKNIFFLRCYLAEMETLSQ